MVISIMLKAKTLYYIKNNLFMVLNYYKTNLNFFIHYTTIPLYPYTLIPLYPYTPIPLYPYTPIPLYL